MSHAIDCSGCPHCDPEMAAIMSDTVAGRFESLSRRLTEITNRTLRFLRMGSTRNRQVVPAPPDLNERIRSARLRESVNQRSDRLIGFFRAGRSPISDAPTAMRAASMITALPPPDLNATLQSKRG